MVRQRTRSKVHEAVLSLAQERPVGKITMEGIAGRAGIGKQTLYRSWPTTGAVFFDALLARSQDDAGTIAVPTSDDLAHDLLELATGTIVELRDPSLEPILRAVTAEMQSDESLASQYRERLLTPQLEAIAQRFRAEHAEDPHGAAEAFVGPIFHCWLLRTHPMNSSWVKAHVARVIHGAVRSAEQADLPRRP